MNCPACHEENRDGARFCDGCGTRLDTALGRGSPHTSTAPEPGSPQPGERRQATILFSDLSGYTAMGERLDPEEVQAVMNRVKAEAVRIIEAHGGMVNQFVGDEVVALFGIPTAHEDDPRQAVAAALELHAVVRALSAEVESRIGTPLRMHTGINSGLIVTHHTDERDGRFGLTGDAVNTGARLLAHAQKDTVLVSPDTHRLVSPFFRTEALDAVAMKGKAEPLVPYRVQGKAGARSRFEAAEQRGLSPLAGREAELKALREHWRRVASGAGRTVLISGEAGVGKSRLLYEFRREIERDGGPWLHGHCLAHGLNTPYLPFADLLGRSLGLRNSDSAERMRESALAGLLGLGADLEVHIPWLLHLLSISSDAHPLPPGVEGEARGEALRSAIVAFLGAQQTTSPLVLVLEDWHWADTASDAVLRTIVSAAPARAMLLLVLTRPESPAHGTPWLAEAADLLLQLDPLSETASAEVMCAVLGVDSVPEMLADSIHGRTAGNPFFTEEICRALLEDGVLSIRSGQVEMLRPVDQSQLPVTLHAVIQSRLDRLGEEARDVVRLASVIGREFASALLEKLAANTEPLERSLDLLQLMEIVFQIQGPPDASFIFKHITTQQVAYETLLLARRRELHGLVGEAIETLYADRTREFCEALAHHFAQSDNVTKAVKYLNMAANKAAEDFSAHEANAHLERALGLLSEEITDEDLKDGFALLAVQWFSYSVEGPTPERVATLYRARDIAATIEDGTKRLYWSGWICNLLSGYESEHGRNDRAMELCQQGIKIARELDNESMLASALQSLGTLQIESGSPVAGIGHIDEALALQIKLGNSYMISSTRMSRAAFLGRFGRFAEAMDEIDDLARLLAEMDDPESLKFHLAGCEGDVMATKGDWQAAVLSMAHCLEVARTDAVPFMEHHYLVQLGHCHFMQGQQDKGMAEIQEGVLGFEQLGTLPSQALQARHTWCEVLALGGSVAAGREVLDQIPVQVDEERQDGQRLLVLGLVHCGEGDRGGSADAMRRALEQTSVDGCRPAAAVTHLRYAEILHKFEEWDEATEQLDQAAALFREMGMDWWLAQANALRPRLEARTPWKGFAPYAE